MAKEYTVRNDSAQIVTIAPRDIVFRYQRDACPDREDSMEGPDADCTVYRRAGVVYPSSGTIDGNRVHPRNLTECQDFFGDGVKA